MALYRLTMTYACGGLITNSKQTIIKTCPIYKKLKGLHIKSVEKRLGRYFIEIKKV